MRTSSIITRAAACALSLGLFAATIPAHADTGFQLERYEPTPAGEWFFAVQHPWYSSTRWFAGGLTLDYGHDPLVAGTRDNNGTFHETTAIIEHQLVGHVDVAGSFLDRVQLSGSLPVVLYEGGHAVDGIAPLSGAAIGDIRLGAMVRVFGQPDRAPISLSLGGNIWIPVGTNHDDAGDQKVRGDLKVALNGLVAHHLRYAFNGGVLLRKTQHIGDVTVQSGNTVGHELQLSAAVGYADEVRRFNIGPEAVLGTIVVDGKAFEKSYTGLEVMLGGNYNIAHLINIGAAVGLGALREPGTPDVRAIFRIAYAPFRKPGPPPDRDHDGYADKDDDCPDQPAGPHPDLMRKGCPLPDADGDGVPDEADLCPTTPAGDHPDAARPGCPAPPVVEDTDKDGVPDSIDLCPMEAAGDHPDPLRKGCPFKDQDNDGVPDDEDLCPKEPAGAHPDPKRAGCPWKDQDGDGIPDDVDACPDRPGMPDPDPARNGCPHAEVRKGTTTVLQTVYFARNKATILEKSFEMLTEIAKTLLANKQIKKVSIEGHADDTGTAQFNLQLSQKRAKSVREFLIKKGVKPSRLTSTGFGSTRPVTQETTEEARATNRRVEFRIVSE